MGVVLVNVANFEASHHDFKLLWEQCFKVTNIKSDKYGKQLLKAVVAFASQHVPISKALSYSDDLEGESGVHNDIENDKDDAEKMSEVING